MSDRCNVHIKRDDGTCAVVTPATMDMMPSFLATGIYLQILSQTGGLVTTDIAASVHTSAEVQAIHEALQALEDLGFLESDFNEYRYAATNVEMTQ